MIRKFINKQLREWMWSQLKDPNVRRELREITNHSPQETTDSTSDQSDKRLRKWMWSQLKDPNVRRELWMIANRSPLGTVGSPCRPFDITDHMYLVAAQDTARFIIEQMPSVRHFSTRKDLFEFAFGQIQEGLVLEFGVHEGTSINMLAEMLPDRDIHGFDSFEGLPEDWIFVPKEVFDVKGKMPDVKKNITLHKGWFDETLEPFLQRNHEKLAFVHIDSDLYSSAKYVLKTIKERLVQGSIIQFDEYFNYPNWQQGEYRAFNEFKEEFGIEFTPLGITTRGYSAAFKVK